MYPNPTIFGVEIIWYSSFHYLGLFLSLMVGFLYTRKYYNNCFNKNEIIILITATIFIMLIGARKIGMCESYITYGEWPSINILFQGPGKGKFRWSGSVLGLFLFLPVIGKVFKINHFKNYMDVLCISLCILTAITKQGCQFSGDGCYGIPTTIPWGMYYPHGIAPNLLPVHPTPIYDTIFHLFLFVFLIYIDRNKKEAGNTALIYFLAVSIFYVLLEMIRINPKTIIHLTISQINFIFIGMAVIYLVIKREWKQFFSINQINLRLTQIGNNP